MSNATSTHGRTKRPKPYQPTLIRMTTARSLAYLESRGLANFESCNLRIIKNQIRDRRLKSGRIVEANTDAMGV